MNRSLFLLVLIALAMAAQCPDNDSVANCASCNDGDEPVCTSCKPGYWSESDNCNSLCNSNAHCSTCSGADYCTGCNTDGEYKYKQYASGSTTDFVCVDCANGKIYGDTCVTSCPDGTYDAAGTCTACKSDAHCSTCSGADYCTGCNTEGEYKYKQYASGSTTDFVCVKDCGTGYFDRSGVCTACTEAEQTECNDTNCQGYTFDTTCKVACTVEHCAADKCNVSGDTHTCSECTGAYYAESSTATSCTPCTSGSGCATCSKATYCDTCATATPYKKYATGSSGDYTCVAADGCGEGYTADDNSKECKQVVQQNCEDLTGEHTSGECTSASDTCHAIRTSNADTYTCSATAPTTNYYKASGDATHGVYELCSKGCKTCSDARICSAISGDATPDDIANVVIPSTPNTEGTIITGATFAVPEGRTLSTEGVDNHGCTDASNNQVSCPVSAFVSKGKNGRVYKGEVTLIFDSEDRNRRTDNVYTFTISIEADSIACGIYEEENCPALFECEAIDGNCSAKVNPSSNGDGDEGLSKAVIAIIVIACVVFVGLTVIIIVALVTKNKNGAGVKADVEINNLEKPEEATYPVGSSGSYSTGTGSSCSYSGSGSGSYSTGSGSGSASGSSSGSGSGSGSASGSSSGSGSGSGSASGSSSGSGSD